MDMLGDRFSFEVGAKFLGGPIGDSNCFYAFVPKFVVIMKDLGE